ncbi:uncharacterized protein [Watersipora subatra]|uniref:uncharacterized protein n=1 Tax=Watersipora subatra TaxID=2589382 RepID=UPI00355C4B7B
MKRLSIAQLVMGELCILFGAILIPVEACLLSASVLAFSGYGIWCGAYFVIVGGIGLGVVKHNTGRWVATTKVLNIIGSTLFCLLLLIMAAIGLFWNAFSFCGFFCTVLVSNPSRYTLLAVIRENPCLYNVYNFYDECNNQSHAGSDVARSNKVQAAYSCTRTRQSKMSYWLKTDEMNLN